MDAATRNEIKDLIEENTFLNDNGCWVWSKTVGRDLYGVVDLLHQPDVIIEFCLVMGNTSRIAAHRLSFFAWNGMLPNDKPFVTHSCNNPSCCNPEHLRAGTAKSNCDDMVMSGTRRPPSRYRARPLHIQEQIRQMIRDGRSSYSIAKIFNTEIGNITRYKRVMEKNNG